jgi:hypothetical protein
MNYLDASLFFSLRERDLTALGTSATGVISAMTLFSRSSSFPIDHNFRGFGVKSFPSPFRAFPLKDRKENADEA